jgi:hypothetical protein
MLSQLDVSLRQAIYYEYLKEYEADREDERTKALLLLLIGLIVDSGIDFTVAVSKSALTKLVTTINATFGNAITAHNGEIVKDLFNMFGVSVDVTAANYIKVAEVGKVINPAKLLFDKQKGEWLIRDKLYSGSAVSNNKLWVKYAKAVMPGTGQEPLTLIKDFGRSILSQTTKLVKQAYAEKMSLADITKRIKGDPKVNYKDGMINKIGNQGKAVVRTLGASASNWLNEQIGSIFFDQYQWISTIDSVTTSICKSRHLNIYTYGEGPIPPAHIGCRSIIVGIDGSVANEAGSNYYSWLQSQPEDVLADVFTPAEAKAFKDGSTNSADYAAFRNDKRLTPEEFKGKISLMETETPDN